MLKIRLNWFLDDPLQRPWVIGRSRNLYGINNSNGRLSEFWRVVPIILSAMYNIILCAGRYTPQSLLRGTRHVLLLLFLLLGIIFILLFRDQKTSVCSIVVHSPVISSCYYEWTYCRRWFFFFKYYIYWIKVKNVQHTARLL